VINVGKLFKEIKDKNNNWIIGLSHKSTAINSKVITSVLETTSFFEELNLNKNIVTWMKHRSIKIEHYLIPVNCT